jgi:hypothetical protein
MHHHQQVRAPMIYGGAQGAAFQIQRLPVALQPHGDRQRIAGGGKIVAKDAIDRRQKRLAPRRGVVRAERRNEPRERRAGRRGGDGHSCSWWRADHGVPQKMETPNTAAFLPGAQCEYRLTWPIYRGTTTARGMA